MLRNQGFAGSEMRQSTSLEESTASLADLAYFRFLEIQGGVIDSGDDDDPGQERSGESLGWWWWCVFVCGETNKQEKTNISILENFDNLCLQESVSVWNIC